MRNFAKSILNYFATYTETRFRFSTKQLAFQWADDRQHNLHVLDLAVFPEVQASIVDCVAANQSINVTVTKDQYVVRLDGQPFARRLQSFLDSEATVATLESLLREYGFYLEQQPQPPEAQATDLFDLPVDRRRAWMEACRQYNLRVRKEFSRRLIELQQAKKDELQASLRLVNAYPIVGGTADNIRRLKMQRLNVGFSRAKDTMVFVHSMPIPEYSDTRLGDALKHYANLRDATHDVYVKDEPVFGSPAERALSQAITQTRFFQGHRDQCRLIAQFEIGKYIRQEYHRYIPTYRVDFLMTMGGNGKERSLIIEYDGIEFHTRNPDTVTAHNFDQEYLEYDVQRQLELESFGYTFLRINKFSLLPRWPGDTPVDVLNGMLERAFA